MDTWPGGPMMDVLTHRKLPRSCMQPAIRSFALIRLCLVGSDMRCGVASATTHVLPHRKLLHSVLSVHQLLRSCMQPATWSFALICLWFSWFCVTRPMVVPMPWIHMVGFRETNAAMMKVVMLSWLKRPLVRYNRAILWS